jgi:hypothetical protein
MKKILFMNLLLFLFFNSQCQIFKVDKHGEELYLLGTQYLELGDYKGADSILSLALCTYKNENVYYNRGVSKLFMQDTIGFCSDMGIASNNYLDIGAEKYFNNFCCKLVDTFYYDKKMQPTSKQLWRYYEVYQEYKYEKERIGKIHDFKAKNVIPSLDFGCSQDLININVRTTDIIGVYKYIDSVKYYYYTEKAPSISINRQTKYENLKKRISMILKTKYKDIKDSNKLIEISVGYSINLSKNGEIISVKYLGTFPEVNFGDREKEFEEDIEQNVKNYPKVTPAKFMKEDVNFIVYDTVKF